MAFIPSTDGLGTDDGGTVSSMTDRPCYRGVIIAAVRQARQLHRKLYPVMSFFDFVY